MTRDDVLDLMFHARTLEECRQAWEARTAWLQEHPDDDTIIDESESLYMREQALKHVTNQEQQTERVA